MPVKLTKQPDKPAKPAKQSTRKLYPAKLPAKHRADFIALISELIEAENLALNLNLPKLPSSTNLDSMKYAASVLYKVTTSVGEQYTKDRYCINRLARMLEADTITQEGRLAYNELTDKYNQGLCTLIAAQAFYYIESLNNDSFVECISKTTAQQVRDLATLLFTCWPEYSGSLVYPVYDAELDSDSDSDSGTLLSAMHSFDFNRNYIRWPIITGTNTAYTDSRKRLLRHTREVAYFLASPNCTSIWQLVPSIAEGKRRFSSLEEAAVLESAYLGANK